MLNGQRIIVIMPAFNAAQTLEQTYRDIPHDIVDEVILVDDCSHDETVQKARALGIQTFQHVKNRGYGGNQKTCYTHALERSADVTVMLHPDYQYDPRLIRAMCSMIIEGPYDTVLGSRILGGKALKGGMPVYKYISNRFLTAFQNACTGAKISEYHTGYRAYRSKVLRTVPWRTYPDDFIFDNHMLCGILAHGFRIGEISCPAKYFPEASSINFLRSMKYGMGVLLNALLFRLHRWGVIRSSMFPPPTRKRGTPPDGRGLGGGGQSKQKYTNLIPPLLDPPPSGEVLPPGEEADVLCSTQKSWDRDDVL